VVGGSAVDDGNGELDKVIGEPDDDGATPIISPFSTVL